MNKIVLAGLLATTLISPITSAMAQNDSRPQRAEKGGDDGKGGGQRGDRGRGPGWTGGQQQAPQAQPQQAPRVQGERNDGGRRGGDAQAQGQGQAQARAQMQAQQGQVQAQQAQQAQAQARQQAQAQQQGQRQFQRGGNDGRFDNGRTNRDQTRAPQSAAQTPQAQIRPDGRVQQDWRGQTSNNRRDDNARRGNNVRGNDVRGNDGRPNGNQGSQGWNNGGNRNGGPRLDDRQRWNGQQRWNNSWRNDRRYDWQNYRNSNRNAFHVQRYNVPYGWSYGYQRFSTGFFLNSLLFGDQYWIDDPYDYRLPPAYGTLRWIRYYDDALLVDIRDGYVVDVIHDFFW